VITTEGRVLAGLDEFMLRAGHLSVICRSSKETDGNWLRLEREAAAHLAAPVSVTKSGPGLPEYLARKKLCRIKGAADNSDDHRYPEIEILIDSAGKFELTQESMSASVEWQDARLSDPAVISKVGAVTLKARSGSKTGLSHVCDWAQLLALLDSNGQLTPMGRLLVGLIDSGSSWNPYALKFERLLIAYQLFQLDLDLLAALLPALARTERVTKSDARTLFVSALNRVCDVLQADASGPSGARFSVFQQLRDLERAAKKGRRDTSETSTAWHRTASRVETLVDVGLLGKQLGAEQYQYVYRSTKNLATANTRLVGTMHAADWIDSNLVDIVFGQIEEECTNPITPDEIELVARMLSLPTTMLPIDCLKLGISIYRAGLGKKSSLEHLRRELEALPARFPASARLTRGSVGTRAEYLSWRYKVG
jgi:hypothetical protein